MPPITFKVPAVPVAQPRPRATSFGGKARMYEAKSGHAIHSFKATVRLAAAEAHTGAPLEGPLAVSIDMMFARPKRLARASAERIRYVSRPDFDNLAKGVCDALNGLLWVDDAQVCDGVVRKWYAAIDEQPHVVVTVEQLSP